MLSTRRPQQRALTRETETAMTTWVLVADNCRARIFSADNPSSPLTEIRDLTHPEARLHEGDLVTDKNGRDRSAGTGGNSLGDGSSHKQEGVDRFAITVCEELEAARAKDTFHKLYIVAAPAFLGMLRKHQSNNIKPLIAAELDKNLATRDSTAIRKQLPDYL